MTFESQQYPILFVGEEPDLLETFQLDYEGDFTIVTASSRREALALVNPIEAHLFEAGLDDGPVAGHGVTLRDEIVRLERELLQRAPALASGNKAHAAEQLGPRYRGLLKKMQRLGLAGGGTRQAS